MKKIIPISIVAVLTFAGIVPVFAEDSVKIYDFSRESESGLLRTVQLSAPMVSFDIKSLISGEGVGDPNIAAVFVNEMQAAPTLAFNVVGNQFTLAQQPYTVELLDGKPDQKGFRAKWELSGGIVSLTLVANDDADPVLYGRLRVERGEAFKILLILAPGGHAPQSEDRDRWVFAENLDAQNSDDVLPMTGNWVLLYDKLLDPESSQIGKGAVGMLWNDSLDGEVAIQCGAYVSTLTVNVPGGSDGRTFDFIFWPFTGVPNDSAKAEIKERAAAMLKTFSEKKSKIFGEGN